MTEERLAEALFEYAYGPEALRSALTRYFNDRRQKKGETPPIWPDIPRAGYYRAQAKYILSSESIAAAVRSQVKAK